MVCFAAELRARLRKMSAAELYAQLQQRDAAAARLVHPNNRFRVMRAFEICLLSGKTKTELKPSQQTLRYPDDTLLFILDADADILCERLDRRVDKMCARGVIEELDDYYKKVGRSLFSLSRARSLQNNQALGTHGVRQVIGIKEFESFLMLPSEERATPAGDRELNAGLERLKLRTRQYAKSQRKWFTQRFLRRGKLREASAAVSCAERAQIESSISGAKLRSLEHVSRLFRRRRSFRPRASGRIPERRLHRAAREPLSHRNAARHARRSKLC